MPQPREFFTATESYRRSDDGWQGEGGCAFVFKVIDSSGQVRALKMLKPEHREKVKGQRFRNEIALLGEIRSPFVVPLLDHGIVEPEGLRLPFFVMPFYPSTLSKLMEGSEPLGKRDPARALRLFDTLLSGVEALHLKRAVHRDIKPKNVLHDPSSDRLLLADFGIADLSEDLMLTAVHTRDGERLASWSYAAPEQRREGEKATPLSDIYSLGLVLGEIFTGVIPEGSEPKSVESVVPSHAFLDGLIDQMRRQEPRSRPQSIAEVKGALLAHQSDFVTVQRLSDLDGRVVPSGQSENPFADEPVRLIDAHMESISPPVLKLVLNRPVTKEWVVVFRASPMGGPIEYPPENFLFDMKEGFAVVELPHASFAPRATEVFKSWLEQMKLYFARAVAEQARLREQAARAQLVAERKATEELLALNRSIRSKIIPLS